MASKSTALLSGGTIDAAFARRKKTAMRYGMAYKNGLHAYVRTPKGAAWELGYKYSVVNDVMNEFFVGCIHRGSWVVDNDPKSLVS
nr:hypothetical protein [Candidatus Sigynarchaeota archaeon]